MTPFSYMFDNQTVHSGTWLDLTINTSLVTMPINKYVAMLVDINAHEYCFVFWDEADQCSNPYRTFEEAMAAFNNYVAHL